MSIEKVMSATSIKNYQRKSRLCWQRMEPGARTYPRHYTERVISGSLCSTGRPHSARRGRLFWGNLCGRPRDTDKPSSSTTTNSSPAGDNSRTSKQHCHILSSSGDGSPASTWCEKWTWQLGQLAVCDTSSESQRFIWSIVCNGALD